jgi:NitT/TauT family transport system permease protein
MNAPARDESPQLFRVRVATTAKRTRQGPLWSVLRFVVPVVAAFVVAVAMWLGVSYLLLSPSRRFLVPPPQEVLATSFLDWTHLEPMLAAVGLTAQVALLGLAIAAVLGISVAIVMSQASWLERALYPYAVVLQTVPILAIVPLIGLWFDYGFTSRVIVCVIIALFPMIANTLFGIQSASPAAHDLFTLHKASRRQRLTKLQMPVALPAIFTGLRTSSGLSVVGAIVGDFFFKQGAPGIGTLLDVYRARLQSDDLFASIILASLFGIAIFTFFTVAARLTVGSWHARTRTD